MEGKIEKVIMLYKHSSNPISYWADMSKYKDKAENLSGCSLMNKAKKWPGNGWPRRKAGQAAGVKRLAEMNIDMFILLYIFLPRLPMIKVSDVDKYSHSQFISSCLAWGCLRQHPRLITSEARGMMLGGGGGEGGMMQLLGLSQCITLNQPVDFSHVHKY